MSAGEGQLRFSLVNNYTIVHTAKAHSPLKLLMPRNHGRAAWVYMASFGGGLVDGDAIRLKVNVDADATALLGTQASTKVYKSISGCSQQLAAAVERRALLAVVPDPVTCFRDARYRQENSIHLAGDASVILVDAMTCGRAAREERWAFTRYQTRTEIVLDGRQVALDALVLDSAHDLAASMGRCEALATVFAVGPRAAGVSQRMLRGVGRAQRRAPLYCSASPLGDIGAIARLAAVRVEKLQLALRELLRPLVEELGDDPFARRQ